MEIKSEKDNLLLTQCYQIFVRRLGLQAPYVEVGPAEQQLVPRHAITVLRRPSRTCCRHAIQVPGTGCTHIQKQNKTEPNR